MFTKRELSTIGKEDLSNNDSFLRQNISTLKNACYYY